MTDKALEKSLSKVILKTVWNISFAKAKELWLFALPVWRLTKVVNCSIAALDGPATSHSAHRQLQQSISSFRHWGKPGRPVTAAQLDILFRRGCETPQNPYWKKKTQHISPVRHQQIFDASQVKLLFLEHHLPVGCVSSAEHPTVHLTILLP